MTFDFGPACYNASSDQPTPLVRLALAEAALAMARGAA